MKTSFSNCSPSLIHLERGNKKGVSKNEKERDDAKVALFNCSPSLIQLERGNKRG
jgi:hypothetical protein